jgi:hypothetical protein
LDPYGIANPFDPADQDFALCKQWLSQCRSFHNECRIKDATVVPTRLLKISLTDPNLLVTLIDNTYGLGEVEWCALSYVWGGEQVLQLTHSTLQTLKDGISITQLPPTLRDAVTVSRSLVIEYIWIDCLCIIQGDSTDLHRELTMVSISNVHSE